MTPPRKNHLQHELSPYLLQHSENPVDWYPWGEEAFTRARELDRLIFLSIGYAACHWCHVMEKESFMDQEIAELLNARYIPVKVDREERPDIDRIYMTISQMMTGSGGWPLTIFLTPDLKPVYAATYIPPRSRGKTPGMLDILPHIATIWDERREEAGLAGDRVLEALKESITASGDRKEGIDDLEEIHRSAYSMLSSLHDRNHGGFGRAPKFPSISQITFLLQYGFTYHDDNAHEMALHTLSSMAYGGIRDQAGYGFHRYATDAAWNIPHFEKMLYDQAMNAIGYITAYQVSGDPLMRETALDCLRYMVQILQHQEGGFGSSEDADSNGEEGAFYLWDDDELRKTLGDDHPAFSRVYTITSFPLPGHPGSGIITRIQTHDTAVPLDEKITEIRKKLSEKRNLRPHPLMDDKVLTDWNGLAIEALAYASLMFDEPWILSAARRAAEFLLSTMMTPDGLLMHRWRKGRASIGGTAQDYIFASSGLTRLFQATGDPRYLKMALGIYEKADELFSDPENGGFFTTLKGDPSIPVRMKDEYDGAVPSVSGHAYQLLRTLAAITGRDDLADQADLLISGMVQKIRKMPLASLSLLSVSMADRGKAQVHAVIVGEPEDLKRRELLRVLIRQNPGLILIPILPSGLNDLREMITGVDSYLSTAEPHVHLCTAGLCRPPVYHSDELRAVLDTLTHS